MEAPPEEALRSLDRIARRGKLPGFRADEAASSFTMDAFGDPFDYDLIGALSPDPENPTRTLIKPRLRVRRRLPVVFGVITLLAIWPGLPLADSLLTTYIPAYNVSLWITAAWYLPLTVLPLPWLFARLWRRSARSAHAEAEKHLGTIARALGGERRDHAVSRD